MRQTTLCFLKEPDRICLAMKKRGFGIGKWNGVGGKVEEGETVEGATLRELKEEIGVSSAFEHMEKVGQIKLFYDNPDWNQEMNIFFINKWEGDPTESEEVLPKWYAHEDIPYEKMWVDDPHWLPKVLSGEKISGEFYFKNNGAEIDRFELK